MNQTKKKLKIPKFYCALCNNELDELDIIHNTTNYCWNCYIYEVDKK